jgi:hypothetical protein
MLFETTLTTNIFIYCYFVLEYLRTQSVFNEECLWDIFTINKYFCSQSENENPLGLKVFWRGLQDAF